MRRRTVTAGLALAVFGAMVVAAPSQATPGSATLPAPAARTGPLSVATSTADAPPDIDVANLQAHLTEFNTIASQNGGNRRAGSAGHTASLTYVKSRLQTAGYTVTEQVCTTCTYRSNNLIAEWPGGPADQVVMFGAHLDGVSAGPGINDNASGSAVLLENALVLAQRNPTMTKRVRFAWWTDEEQGLNGSEFYVASLNATQRSYIKGYYNFDMVASTNGGYFINRLTSTTAAPLKAYWDSLNLQPEENTEGQGRSDDYPFQQAGIPTSGYAMGASARKTSAQAAKWGGTANSAYDPCYHRSCDTTSNVNATGVNRSADGVAYAIWNLAVSSGPVQDDFSIAANPGSGSAQPGASTSTTVSTAVTSGSAQTVALSATGAPSGVTVSFTPSSVQSGQSATATISVGTAVGAGTYQITITGTGTVATRSTTYTLTVGGSGGCAGGQKLGNPGFETGTSPWTGTTAAIGSFTQQPAHGGTRVAWLGGNGRTSTETLSQSVTLPAGCTNYNLNFWLHIDTAETTSSIAYDTFRVQVLNSAGTVLGTLATYSNLNKATGYSQKTFSLNSYAGQTITLRFTATEDVSLQTSFVVDDTDLTVS